MQPAESWDSSRPKILPGPFRSGWRPRARPAFPKTAPGLPWANSASADLLAATFAIIPFVGPFFTGATAVIIAFTSAVLNPGLIAFYVLVYFVIIQQIEGHILTPTLMNRAVGLHPVAVLISMLIGVKLFGIIGLLLAGPASVVIQEFVEDWNLNKSKLREVE